MHRRLIVLAVSAIAIAGAIYWLGGRTAIAPNPIAMTDEEAERAVGKAEEAFISTLRSASVIQHADRVTLYRIASPMDPDYPSLKDHPKAAGYPVLDQITIQPRAARGFAKDIVTRNMYFPPGDGWTCLWEPGYVAEMTIGKQIVRIVICLKCGDVVFEPSTAGAEGEHSLTPDGHRQIARDLALMWPASFPRVAAGSPAKAAPAP